MPEALAAGGPAAGRSPLLRLPGEQQATARPPQALRESPAAFERWCDNRIIETIRAAENAIPLPPAP